MESQEPGGNCQGVGCQQQARYSPPSTVPRACKYHKLPGMILLRRFAQRCAHPGCLPQPAYGFRGKEQARFHCAKHRLPDMIKKVQLLTLNYASHVVGVRGDRRSPSDFRRCSIQDCGRLAHFREPGRMVLVCKVHHLKSMVDARQEADVPPLGESAMDPPQSEEDLAGSEPNFLPEGGTAAGAPMSLPAFEAETKQRESKGYIGGPLGTKAGQFKKAPGGRTLSSASLEGPFPSPMIGWKRPADLMEPEVPELQRGMAAGGLLPQDIPAPLDLGCRLLGCQGTCLLLQQLPRPGSIPPGWKHCKSLQQGSSATIRCTTSLGRLLGAAL